MQEALRELYTASGIDPDFLENHLSSGPHLPFRYFYLNDSLDTIDVIRDEIELLLDDNGSALEMEIAKVQYLTDFYRVPGWCPMARLPSFLAGRIHALDAASGVAVQALQIKRNEHVLDLCCAPGAKMTLMALQGAATVTGVDLSRTRLCIARKMIKKYNVAAQCRLFCGDGAEFDEGAQRLSVHFQSARDNCNSDKDSHLPETLHSPTVFVCPQRSEGRNFGAQRFAVSKRAFCGSDTMRFLYDKVLVDAECTHDGSIAHLIDTKKHQSFLQKSLVKAGELPDLQIRLLRNGFRLLRPGGLLVYSTCSVTRSQNESVIYRFLSENKDARLQTVPGKEAMPCFIGNFVAENKADELLQEITDKCVRFSADLAQGRDWTSGMFVALILKL